MPPKLFTHCVSCGYRIVCGRTWQSRYQILYRAGDRVRLTPPGQKAFLNFVYWSPTKGLPVGSLSNPETNVVDGVKMDIQDGFVFHAVCWYELCGCFGPAGPDLEGLYTACMESPKTTAGPGVPRQLPFSTDGIFLLTSSPPRPSMRRIWKIRSQDPTGTESSYVQAVRRKTRALRYLFELRHQDRCKGRCRRVLRLSHTQLPPPGTSRCPDIFGRLPVEIRSEITYYLSTPDFFTLRLASRSMACLFDDQTFWRPRSLHRDDRGVLGHIFQQQGIRTRGAIDWRGLYRYSWRHADRLAAAVYGQMKRWQNNAWLREKTLSASGELPPGRNIMAGSCDSPNDCVVCKDEWMLAIESVMLPQHDVEFAVWVSGREDDTVQPTCVAGIAISSPGQPTTHIGYRLPQEPVRLRVSTLRWIAVASHEDGMMIAGIAMGNTESLSELTWAGQHEGPGVSRPVKTYAATNRYLVAHYRVGMLGKIHTSAW